MTGHEINAKAVRMSLWGQVCEYWVNNPDVSMKEIGLKFGISEPWASTIISKYLGRGEQPVIIHFAPQKSPN